MIIRGRISGLRARYRLRRDASFGIRLERGACAALSAGVLSLSLCWVAPAYAESPLLFQCQMTTGTHVRLTDEGSALEYRMGVNLAEPDAQFEVPKTQVSTKPWRQHTQEEAYSLTLPYKNAAITLFYSRDLQKRRHAVNAGLFVKQPGQAADLMMCRSGTVEQHLADFSITP